jgi:hypothetical protein
VTTFAIRCAGVDLRPVFGVMVTATPVWAQGVPEPHAVQLTDKARVAAKAGHGEIVAKYDPQVHDLDGLYYETVFQTDAARSRTTFESSPAGCGCG